MCKFAWKAAFAVLCMASIFWAQAASPNDWPSKPVRMVLPYPPGGASDVTARLLAAKLSQAWGQSVVVDNRPGANGIIANVAVSKAPADGYTLLMANLGPNAINPAVYSKLPYDSLKDFAPVVLTTMVPLVIVTSPNSEVKTLRDLIALAKAKPNQVNFGSPGNGASNHIAGELLNSMTGVKMGHVAYKGDAAAMTDVMGGQITVSIPTALAAMPLVKSGKLLALAVTSKKRVPSLPNVPTVDEALGLSGYEAVSWGGIMVPAGTPQRVITSVNAEINRALQMPDVRENLNALGAEIVGGTPQAFDTFLRAEIAKWKRVAQAANVHLN